MSGPAPGTAGETDLGRLLAALAPRLHPGEVVFCTLPPDAEPPAGVVPLGLFVEAEGPTLILDRGDRAAVEAAGFACSPPFRRIVLEVHSSLEAVGLLAAVSAELAGRGIPSNVVSAYFHDHLFVPSDRADEALAALAGLSSRAAEGTAVDPPPRPRLTPT